MAKLKQRDQIIEKNKKLKTSKKPEEPVPIIDNIEQDPDHGWVLLKNVQFKHVNLCMNDLGDELREPLQAVLRRTGEDFGVTLAGNPISAEVIQQLQQGVIEAHKLRVQQQFADNPMAINGNLDAMVGQKRVAF